jgi:hypothetical protein
MESKETVVLAITDTEDGLEVRLNEGAYGNLAIVGLLERIKFTLLNDVPSEKSNVNVLKSTKYDA